MIIIFKRNTPQVQFMAKPIHDRKVNSCRRQFILALLEREGGIRRMTGGFIFFTYISYLLFYSSCAHAAWHFLWLNRAPKEAKCPLLQTRLVIFRIYLQSAFNSRLRSDQVVLFIRVYA